MKLSKMNYPSLVLFLIILFVTMRSVSAVIDWFTYVDPQDKLELIIEQRGVFQRRIPTCKRGESVYFNKISTGELIYWCGR